MAPTVTPARITRVENAAASYRRVEAQLLALPEDQVGRVTADVAHASAIALGALPNLLKLKDELAQLPNSDRFVGALNNLQDYAMAAFYAHLRAMPGGNDKEVLQLLERGKPIRENLLAIATGLVGFGLFDAALVQNIREGQGNLDTAKDLAALSALFSANWDRVENKVPFGIELVDEAGQIGANLLHAIGITDVGEVRKDTAFDWLSLRARAFRLLVTQYEELRRATAFVRWHHGDATAFAPSLHAGARPRRRSRGEADGSDDTADETANNTALLGSEEPSLGANTGANGAAAIPAGMPGASPFEA
jgi:hypothetical protein